MSRATELLKFFEEDPAAPPPAPPAREPIDDFEMNFTHRDRKAVAWFQVFDRGSPNKTTYQHYEPGDAPDLEFHSAMYDGTDDLITDMTPEEIQALVDQAEEEYAEREANREEDPFDAAGDR